MKQPCLWFTQKTIETDSAIFRKPISASYGAARLAHLAISVHSHESLATQNCGARDFDVVVTSNHRRTKETSLCHRPRSMVMCIKLVHVTSLVTCYPSWVSKRLRTYIWCVYIYIVKRIKLYKQNGGLPEVGAVETGLFQFHVFLVRDDTRQDNQSIVRLP